MTKKRSLIETQETEDDTVRCRTAPEAETITEAKEVKVDENAPRHSDSDLQVALEKICKIESVKGYILKDAITATINLDPALLEEYALLASQSFDCYGELESLFNLGNFKSTILEYGNLKILCTLIGKTTANVFMTKDADPAKIQNILSKLG